MFVRERWAQLTNEAFRSAGLSLRVDHRSYKARGIDREPIAHIPTKILYMERARGVATKAGENIRRRHRERVEARLRGPDELARVLERHKEEFAQLALERQQRLAACPKKVSRSSLTKEELAQRHHAWYLANRPAELAKKRARYRENAVVIRERARLARLRAKAPTEQQSVERWLEWRKQPHPTVTAEESVRNWLALRERDRQADAAGKRREIDHSYDHTLDHDHDLGL
jgi:hypothetical protein